MNYIEILASLLIIFFIINKFLLSKKLFIDPKKNSNHKSFLSNNDDIPFSGGILILISSLIFFPLNGSFFSYFLILIFVIGLFSDLEIIKSPFKRIIFQTTVITIYIHVSQNLVPYTRIPLIDNLFEIYYVKLLFTLFCMLVLINGSNFIDGVNTLTASYYALVIACVIYLKYNYYFDHEILIEKVMFLTLLIFLVFNFFGKAYLGDSGAYLISFIVGAVLINFVNNYVTVSPYFIACLLWYPAYENLFSIIRKKLQKISPSKPDNKHLHQLLFVFIKKLFKMDRKLSNTLTGIIINFFNLFVFLLATFYHSNTKILVTILIFNVSFYTMLYFQLRKIKY